MKRIYVSFSIYIGCLVCVLATHSVLAQPHDTRTYLPSGLPPPSPEKLANLLIDYSSIIVDGYFLEIDADEKLQEGVLEQAVPITIAFHIDKVYKENLKGDMEIDVQLSSDMLPDSTGEISRHERRREIVEQQIANLNAVDERIAELRLAQENGGAAREDIAEELEGLAEIRNELLTSGLIVQLDGGPLHGETFYSRGGVIRAEEKYLLAITNNSAPPP